jgi:D-alanyl-D-alanine dipeptidase
MASSGELSRIAPASESPLARALSNQSDLYNKQTWQRERALIGSDSSSPTHRALLAFVGAAAAVACAAFAIGYVVGHESQSSQGHKEACLPADFVDAGAFVPALLLDMRYATPHNFVGRAVTGYNAPRCWLTKKAAKALAKVSADAQAEGYALKAYDCYRPQRAVDAFVAWQQNPFDVLTRAEFYANTTNKSALFPQYIAYKSGHSRGSTLDLTLVPLPVAGGAPAPAPPPYHPGQPLLPCTNALPADRYPDSSVDMGCGFDCFDTVAHTLAPSVGPGPAANRARLVGLMEGRGFVNYDQEFWHFTLAHEPYPDTYFDAPIQDKCDQ